MKKPGLSMGERFIPSLGNWSEKKRAMFYGVYGWASQFAMKKIVLDCACGSGYGSDILSKVCTRVIGADVDIDIIRYAQENYQNEKISFKVFSVTSIPFPDDYFDLVVSFDTIEHVEDDEGMLSELKRVTKERGEIILSTPVGYYHKSQGEEGLFDVTHVREYSGYEWLSILSHHFSDFEFFTRDQNFQFLQVYPGPFAGSPFDLGFVKVKNSWNEQKINMIDEVKEQVAVHMTYKIKALEDELNSEKSNHINVKVQSYINRLIEKFRRFFHIIHLK
jgi:SAM-dependent methyltransferase